jgi:Na+/proline symporter
MRSVVWNDCIQFVIYILGAVLAGAVILNDLPGGWKEFIDFGQSHEKFRVIDLSFDLSLPYTLWAGVIGGAFLSLGSHGTDQMMVQRYLCARTQRDAAKAVIVSGGVVLVQFLLFLILGVALAAFYHEYPPAEPFAKPDDVFPTFIIAELPVGILGLTLAAVFSAAMSTLSSSLNSSATAAVNDLYLPLRRTEPSSKHLVRMSQGLTVVFGLVQIGIGITGRYFAASVVNDVLAIAGFTTGLLLGVFFLGVLTKRVSQRAALVGLTGGLLVMTAIKFGGPLTTIRPEWFSTEAAGKIRTVSSLAWPWYTVVGSLATFLLGCLASLVWPETKRRRA